MQTGDGCWDSHPNPPPAEFNRFGPWPPLASFCDDGEAAVGIHGRSGAFVDALGLICGPKPKPIKVIGQKPKPIKVIGRAFATAQNDVDVYNSPVEPRKVIGMMRAKTKATIVGRHQDGWCQLRGVANDGGDGWVPQDHLGINCRP